MWMVQSCVCTGWIINKLNLNQTRSRAVYAECMVSTRLQVFSWTGPTLPLLTQRQSRGTMRTSVPLAYIPHLVCYNFSSISILWANIKDIVQFVQLKQSYHLFKSHCPWGGGRKATIQSTSPAEASKAPATVSSATYESEAVLFLRVLKDKSTLMFTWFQCTPMLPHPAYPYPES